MKKIILSVALAAAMVPGYAQTTEKTEYVVVTNANGNRIFTGAIDYDKEAVSFAGDNVIITVKDKAPVTFAKSQVAEINIVDYPVADLFDAVWNADGTAKDLGKFNLAVEKMGRADRVVVNAENPYGIMCPTFDNEYAVKEGATATPATGPDKIDVAKVGTKNAFYRALYSSVMNDFNATIADGFASEMIIKITTDLIEEQNDDKNTNTSCEVKPFSCTQSGGFGFTIRPLKNKRCLAFQINASNKYYYGLSEERPEKDVYYHCIGVYDKAQAKLNFYINGKQMWSVDTKTDANGNVVEGVYLPVSVTNSWLGIGADPGGTSNKYSESSFPGQVVVARMYDQPLTDAEVQRLFQRAEEMKQK